MKQDRNSQVPIFSGFWLIFDGFFGFPRLRNQCLNTDALPLVYLLLDTIWTSKVSVVLSIMANRQQACILWSKCQLFIVVKKQLTLMHCDGIASFNSVLLSSSYTPFSSIWAHQLLKSSTPKHPSNQFSKHHQIPVLLHFSLPWLIHPASQLHLYLSKINDNCPQGQSKHSADPSLHESWHATLLLNQVWHPCDLRWWLITLHIEYIQSQDEALVTLNNTSQTSFLCFSILIRMTADSHQYLPQLLLFNQLVRVPYLLYGVQHYIHYINFPQGQKKGLHTHSIQLISSAIVPPY